MAIIERKRGREYRILFDYIETKWILQIAKLYGITKEAVVGAVLSKGFQPYVKEVHEADEPERETPNGSIIEGSENGGQ